VVPTPRVFKKSKRLRRLMLYCIVNTKLFYKNLLGGVKCVDGLQICLLKFFFKKTKITF
jgi:hypothetical protein